MFNSGMGNLVYPMVTGQASPSLADIAAVTQGNYNNGWGNGSDWWAWIILLAIFCGGGNAFGGWGNGGNGQQFTEATMQRGFDTQSIISKLDGINSGICSLGYDQLNQMNGISRDIMQTGFGLQQGINAVDVNAMRDANDISRQLAECCCENRQGQADIRYAMAKDTCDVVTAIERMGDRIMQNDNANYRQLHDEQVAAAMEAKNAQIAAQAQRIAQLELKASQCDQTNDIINTLRPWPVASYEVCNPYTGGYGGYASSRCGGGYNDSCCGRNGNC